MKLLDNLYEAYQNYKKLCVLDNETSRFMSGYMRIKDRDSEDIVTIFSVCHIEKDWVEAIETGLPFIEKAIKEERQFIRNNGEVLPIEKIRKTSKDSIQDLAKHANYITHEAPEDLATEVLPDKMLMIQKESDFAIYENRVLYAALIYLKDFVTSRLATIKETTNTYLVKQHINKIIDIGARKIKVDLNFDERHVNDPLLTEKNLEKDVIDRLDEILTNILALLKTPLMREVSKAEMVSRPIAKTNILKMNRNFRESLACFDYIANYQGQGFTIEHIEKSLIPYSKEMNEAYAENLIMLSFINYMFANNLQDELKRDYDVIIKNRELQKQNETLAKLRELHATANEKEQSINEFLLAFEQGYRILESRNDTLNALVKENEARRVKEIEGLETKRENDLKELGQQHQDEIDQLNAENQEKIDNLVKEYDRKILNLELARQEEVRNVKENAAKEYNDFLARIQEQDERIAVLEAELIKYRQKSGETKAKDYNSEEAFDDLEKLKNDFDKFYEKAWKAAKKQIRKDVLFSKKKKPKKGEIEEEQFEDVDEQVASPVADEAPIQQPVEEQPKEVQEAPVQEEIKEEPVKEETAGNNLEDNSIEEPIEEPSEQDEIVNEAEEVIEPLNNKDVPIENNAAEEQAYEEPVKEDVVEEEEVQPIEEPIVEESQVDESIEEQSVEEPPIEEPVDEQPIEEPIEEQPLEEEPIEEEPVEESSPVEEPAEEVANEEAPIDEQPQENEEPQQEEPQEEYPEDDFSYGLEEDDDVSFEEALKQSNRSAGQSPFVKQQFDNSPVPGPRSLDEVEAEEENEDDEEDY